MFQWIKAKLWQRKADRWLKQGKAQLVGINCIVAPDGCIYKHDLRKYCEFTNEPIEMGEIRNIVEGMKKSE